MAAWDELLDEFRALGGTADNIRLGRGALGRGLFAIDSKLPIRIRVPDNVLASSDDVVFENGALKLSPGAAIGARERQFVEDYYANFGWGGGGRKGIEATLQTAQALPPDLRRALKDEFRLGRWFEDYSPSLMQEQFVVSRHIQYGERTVMMPILDLVNHGRGGNYNVGKGILLEGVMQDEVLVHYSDVDSFGVFLTWGFACEQPQAMSIALTGAIGQTRLHIDREFGNFKTGERAWIPSMSSGIGGVNLAFLMTGNRQYPRLCRGIFYKLMRDAGLAGFEEAYDVILHVNRMHFLGLLGVLEGVEGEMAHTLRTMARLQLQTMSFSFGVRAV